MKKLILIALMLMLPATNVTATESFRKTAADFAQGNCTEIRTAADVGTSCDEIQNVKGSEPCIEGVSEYCLGQKKQMAKKYGELGVKA